MCANTVHISLVVEASNGGLLSDYDDDWAFQTVDVTTLQPVGHNLYVVKTQPFDDDKVKNGAGRVLTIEEIKQIVENLQKLK